MRHASSTTIGLLLVVIAGCGGGGGGPSATPTPLSGPHGGVLVGFPDGKGYGEVLIESKPAAGKSAATQVVAYFLRGDLTAAMAPLPGDVKVKLDVAEGESVTVDLVPEPTTGPPTGAGRFASPPGPYQVDLLIGELSASHDGQAISERFASPR